MEKTLRVACYERVSLKEQAQNGLSIDSQIFALDKWVLTHNYINMGHYTDAGISGGKPIEKRPAMWQLLQEIEADQIDLVIFTKLDRWFRSLPNYYKAQEILEKHHCAWQAIDEDYETITSAGKFKTNIMLSVAQQERERTGERIRAIFDYKRAKGEFASGGHSVPWGYKLNHDKKLVKDPAIAPAVDRFWQLIISGETCNNARKIIDREFGIKKVYQTFTNISKNPIYKGWYNDQPNFCEPYIDPDTFDRLQKHPMAKTSPSGRIYLFTGLIRCPDCGTILTVCAHNHKGTTYISYRCQRAMKASCTYKRNMSERIIESKLITLIFPENAKIVLDDVKSKSKPKQSVPTVPSIQEKLKRLGEIYRDGLIDKTEYKSQLDSLRKQLVSAQNSPKSVCNPPLEQIRTVLQGDLKDAYMTLSKANKRRFWRRFIKSIYINFDDSIQVIFI